MPKINIEHPHTLSPADAKQKLETLSTDLSEKYGLTVKWINATEAKVERTGANGTIKIGDRKVNVDLDLSFVLSPMKATIETKIREQLTRLFAV